MLLNRRPDATERLVEFAETVEQGEKRETVDVLACRQSSVDERLSHALVRGISEFVEEDAEEGVEESLQEEDIEEEDIEEESLEEESLQEEGFEEKGVQAGESHGRRRRCRVVVG